MTVATLDPAHKATTSAIGVAVQPCPGETYPEDFAFTAREMVGRRFLCKGQEVVCAYVERLDNALPKAEFALDFTKGYRKTKGLKAQEEWGPESQRWVNTIANLPLMTKTLNKLPQVDTVYCVGSGPSLMNNWEALKGVDKSKAVIVGCNELLQYLPAGLIDYYTALDARSPDKWWRGYDLSRTTAILGSIVTPSFATAPWRDVLWYRIGFGNQLNSMVANRHGWLSIVNPLYGVGPSELEIAWLFRPKTVVLVGHSYCFDRIGGVVYEHLFEPLTEERYEGVLRAIGLYTTSDILGRATMTDYHIMITGMMALASCQLLIDAGVRVVNATEGGILKSNPDIPAYRDRPMFPEAAKLAEIVKELQG